LIVSVAGVIQQPNTGTSAPSSGFAINGNQIIFGANLSVEPDFTIYLQGAGVASIADNTVTGAKIALGSDASGDIMYYNGTDYVRLAKGSDGQILKLASGAPSWATAGSGTPEGEAVLSTTNSNEAATKFLRADGDGTCSWQVPPDTNTQVSIDDTPVDGVTNEAISSNWAYDHNAATGNGAHVPAAGSSGQFLKHDATWGTPPDTNTQLSTEQVQDIVGAMFTGNTETNITATYEDSDGTIDLVSTDTNTQLSTEEVQDIVGAMFTGNTETNIAATYEDSDGTIDLVSTDTNTQLSTEEVQDIAGPLVATGGTKTGITVTYDDTNGDMDFVVDDTTKLPLAGGTITGDVVFDNATHAGDDLTWDMSDKALEFDDNVKATFGDGADLEVFHDGSHSYIHNSGTGNLQVKSDESLFLRINETEESINCNKNGSVEIFHDNVKEFETKTGGVKLLGHSESIVTALTSASSVTIDFSLSNHFSCTMGHNIAFGNPTTESVGQSGTIVLTQDGTGSRTASWGSQFLWAGGTAPTLSTGANAVDRIDYVVAAADKIHCVASLGMA